MSLPSASLPRRLLDNAPLVVFFLLLFDSFHLVFARLLAPLLPPLVASFYVMAVATVQLAVGMVWLGQLRWQLLWKHFWFFAAVGGLVGGAMVFSYTSMTYIDPGTGSLLARASTIFSIGFGLVWLRERLNALGWVGTAVALVGVVIISFQPGDFWQLGALFVLGSSFMYALHAAVVKRYGGEIDFANFFFFRVLGTSVILLAAVLGSGSWEWPSTAAWLILLITATVDVVLSRILYYLVLRRIEMSYHAIILTLSPVITIFWSWLFFTQFPTWQGMGGGLLTIAGVALVTRSRQMKKDRG